MAKFQAVRATRWHRRTRGLAAGMLTMALYAAIVMGAPGDTTADRVLGQLDFTHNAVNMMNAQGLNQPTGVAIDASATPNRVYVADDDNSRVLWAGKTPPRSPTAPRPTW